MKPLIYQACTSTHRCYQLLALLVNNCPDAGFPFPTTFSTAHGRATLTFNMLCGGCKP